MLKTLANVGYLTKRMLIDNLNIADRRITNFQRDNYIEKCSVVNKKSKTVTYAYRLTEKGHKYAREQLNINYFYRSSSAAHDITLAKTYFALNAEEQGTWKTENQLRDQFLESLEKMRDRDSEHYEQLYAKWEEREISTVDALYTTEEGAEIGLEIVTDSYGNAEIEAKEEFCSVMDLEPNFEK